MSWATHVLQWRLQKEAIVKAEAKPQKSSQFGLQSETRLYEVGIASNRRSARYGESVTRSCTYRLSRAGN